MKNYKKVFSRIVYSLVFLQLYFLVALLFFYRLSFQDIVYIIQSPKLYLIYIYLTQLIYGSFFLLVGYLIKKYLIANSKLTYSLLRPVKRWAIALYVLSLMLSISAAWINFNVPLDDPNSIIFSIFFPFPGSDLTIFINALIEIPLYTLFYLFVTVYSVYPLRKLLKTRNCNIYIMSATLTLFFLSFFYFMTHLEPMILAERVQKGITKPVDSTFYQTNYIDPESVNIQFPEEKKNLLFILLESVESTFLNESDGGIMPFNNLPNLTQIAKNNINFSHHDKIGGGYDLAGTGWTVAAMVSKTAGIPLNLPLSHDPKIKSQLLPNAISINSILDKEGYNQRFVFGSEKQFACRDLFLESHGIDEIYDYHYYLSNGKIPDDYRVFWGFEDLKIY